MIKEWFSTWILVLCAMVLLAFVFLCMLLMAVHDLFQRFRDRRLYEKEKDC